MPTLTQRLVKGSVLTWEELDQNLTVIRDYYNAMANLIATCLNDDGTIKNDAVLEPSIKSRSVSQRALSLTALPFFADTGSTDAFHITPDPASTAYEHGMVFWVRAARTNTGPCTLKVNDLEAVPIYKLGNTELEAGDIRAAGVFLVAYFNSVFHLVSGAGAVTSGSSGSSGTNFTGLTKYDSGETELIAVSTPTTYTHGLGVIPSWVVIRLVCTNADGAYSAGDRLPLETITDGAGLPAFIVQIGMLDITLTRTATAISLHDPAAYELTDASWAIRVEASTTYNEATNLFPALTVAVHKPEGAFSYASKLFFQQWGTAQAKSTMTLLDLATNRLRPLDAASDGSNPRYINAAPFRFADGNDYVLFTSNTGLFSLALEDPGTAWRAEEICPASTYAAYKPVWLVGTNEVYCVYSQQGTALVSSIPCVRITPSASAAYGTPFNLCATEILGREEFIKWYAGTGSGAKVMLFQYNPVKGRIYVVTDEVFGLHIFELVGTKDFKVWWDQGVVTRAGNLKYLKTLALGGDGAAWADSQTEHICVEFDLGTGQEIAVAWSRPGTATKAGSVTRVPWREVPD